MLRVIILILVSLVSTNASIAGAATPNAAEIEHLLGYVERSNCEFYRNGSWHSASEARAHLEQKYRYLRFRGSLATTEDFIDQTARGSSMSGKPYQVKCEGAQPVSSAEWLTEELQRLRRASATTKP